MAWLSASSAQAGSIPVPEVSSIVQLALVMVMGAGLGLTLGVPQWWVLRRYARQAGWWVLANLVAWALGMPVLLLVALQIPEEASRVTVALIALAASVLTGAAVGAVHGVELVRILLRLQQEEGHVQSSRI
jgi:NhaP-type Na+/H+ or K+/H+ antiporter